MIDAALIGLPHKTLGEEPAAVVQLAPGAEATEEELKAWVRERLAIFKTPVRIAFLDRAAAAQRQRQDPEGRAEGAVRLRRFSIFALPYHSSSATIRSEAALRPHRGQGA